MQQAEMQELHLNESFKRLIQQCSPSLQKTNYMNSRSTTTEKTVVHQKKNKHTFSIIHIHASKLHEFSIETLHYSIIISATAFLLHIFFTPEYVIRYTDYSCHRKNPSTSPSLCWFYTTPFLCLF